MTVLILVFTIEVTATVVGQLLVKHAMEGSRTVGFTHPRILTLLAGGVGALTISSFLTIALLQHPDLSGFYPMHGSTVLMTTRAASISLLERLTPQLLIDPLLI